MRAEGLGGPSADPSQVQQCRTGLRTHAERLDARVSGTRPARPGGAIPIRTGSIGPLRYGLTQGWEGGVGLLDRLFGGMADNPAKRTVEDGQICAKCGRPVARDNMAFDSGGGRPIHRVCPELEAEPPAR